MTAAQRLQTLSVALHGALSPDKPCLWSGFLLDANDQPIGPALSGWIVASSVKKPPAKRGPKPKVLKNAAVLFAHLCWTDNDRLKRYEADQKACELFEYADPRSVKKVISKARRALPHGLIMVETSSTMVILFDGFPLMETIPPDTVTLAGPAFDWRYPERQARYSVINLTLTAATRIDLERFHVTLRDMAIIPRKSG